MIRSAVPADVGEIHDLVCELAVYEKLRHTVVSSPADLETALFGKHPLAEAIVAEAPPESTPDHSRPVALAGMAIFYPTFSTFSGKPGLWLEDVFVRPAHRRQGIGSALIEHFLAVARQRGCARAEWSVLDWNEPAIRFYEDLGAEVLPDWRIVRLAL